MSTPQNDQLLEEAYYYTTFGTKEQADIISKLVGINDLEGLQWALKRMRDYEVVREQNRREQAVRTPQSHDEWADERDERAEARRGEY